MPVKYYHSKNAWITQEIFIDWFHTHFEPEVRAHLTSLDIDPNVVLFLDCGVAHPHGMMSTDGKIRCVFFPPDISPVANPTERGLITSLKCRYKINMIARMAQITSELFILPSEFLKSYTVRDTMFALAELWANLEVNFLRAVWHKLGLNLSVAPFIETIDGKELMLNFAKLGLLVDETKCNDWLNRDCGDPGYGFLTDQEILQSIEKCGEEGALEGDADDTDDFDFENIDLSEIGNLVESENEEESPMKKPPHHQLHQQQPVIAAEQVVQYADEIVRWLETQTDVNLENILNMLRIKEFASSKSSQLLLPRSDFYNDVSIVNSEINGSFSMTATEALQHFQAIQTSHQPSRSSITITKIT